jgi:DNA primase
MTKTERDDRLAKAKRVSIYSYLKGIGIEPLQSTGSSYIYNSPLRSEAIPSFNVSKVKNAWTDFGTNEKGDLPDLVMKLNRVGLHEAITLILGKPQQPDTIFEPRKSDKKNVEILSEGKLYSKYLWDYIDDRKIQREIANRYLVELSIRFPNGKFPDRTTQVIGFKNDSGGYEMRSKTIKISNSPKNVTTFKGSYDSYVYLFEGFFSYLSFLQREDGIQPSGTVVVLNSLSFLPQMIDYWAGRVLVYSFLDNDKAGDKATALLKVSTPLQDMRNKYKGYNDWNDFICQKPIKQPIKSIQELITR